MGVALGWAMTASPAHAMAVFVMMGAGLALPVALVGSVPSLSRWLPRPGAWMNRFKVWMSIPVFVSVLWLLWVLWRQAGWLPALVWVATALALFVALRIPSLPRLVAPAVSSLAVAALLLSLPSGKSIAPRFDETRIASSLRSGHPVFVNVTADWCVTCKVNERTLFSGDQFKGQVSRANAVVVAADYSVQEDGLASYLERMHAPGVPLYVAYATNGRVSVLPQFPTADQILSLIHM